MSPKLNAGIAVVFLGDDTDWIGFCEGMTPFSAWQTTFAFMPPPFAIRLGAGPITASSNNRPLPSLARPRLLHRLYRKHSKIFVHPLGMRLDVCNGHTRS